jgi:toxin ParE1/3/4
MARTVYRRPQAITDLIDIARSIARNSGPAAERFLVAAEHSFGQLAKSPGLGAVGEFSSTHLRDIRRWRVKGFENYLVFYRDLADGVEIVRVLHGARDIEQLFDDAEGVD